MGSKSGLATGVEYFTMITTYNGFKTSFMVFSRDYEPITQEHEQGFQEIWEVSLLDGSTASKTIYWEPTDEQNGVEVILPVKKHNQDAFILAVKQQFSYFKNLVEFRYPFKYSKGYATDFLYQPPLYESDTLVIPDDSVYSVPHIIVDNINYGPINFPELELERRRGKIGIKVKANDVDITQNRESLKYTDKTKTVILAAVRQARKQSSVYVASLTHVEEDANVFDKFRVLQNIGKSSENVVAYEFSTFLDIIDILPVINIPALGIKRQMDGDLFEELFYNYQVKKVTMHENRRGGVVVNREDVKTFVNLSKNVVFADTASLGVKKSIYLMEKFNVTEFTYIRSKTREIIDARLITFMRSEMEDYGIHLDGIEFDFSEEEGSESHDVTTKTTVSLADMRKLNKEVLYQEYTYKREQTWGSSITYVRERYDKTDIKIKDIKDDAYLEGAIVTTKKHVELAKMIEYVNFIAGRYFTVIHVSESVLKHFLPKCTYITEYLKTYNPKTKTIMLGEAFRKLNTINEVRKLSNKYSSYSRNMDLLENLVSFDVPTYTNMKSSSEKTVAEEMQRSYGDTSVRDAVLGYLDKLKQVQDIIDSSDDETIASETKKLLGGEIYHVDSYDKDFYTQIKVDLDRLVPLSPILDNVCSLSNPVEFTKLVNKILPLID